MLQLILRHYRRMAVFSGGMALFWAMLAAQIDMGLGALIHIAGFLTLLVAFAAIALALYSFKPRHRSLLEISGIGAWLGAFVLLMPGMGTVAMCLGLATMVGTTVGLWAFLRSPVARRIGINTTWRDRYSGQIAYPARLVWRHVVPGAAEPIDHCTGMVAHYEGDADDPDTVHMTFKGRKGRAAQYTLTFLERDPPSACRFFFQGTEADGTVVDGIFSLRITTLDRDACFVSCVEERCGLSLGALMERWFDDALGYQHDKLVEKLDELYGETYRERRTSIMAAE